MRRKTSAIASMGLLASCVMFPVAQAEADQFDVTGMTVVIHRGQSIPLTSRKAKIDRLATMMCKSANGCNISIQAQIETDNVTYGYTVRAIVDGQRANPRPQFQYGYSGNSLQSVFDLTQGPHTVQTTIEVQNDNTPSLGSWQINYTMYDK